MDNGLSIIDCRFWFINFHLVIIDHRILIIDYSIFIIDYVLLIIDNDYGLLVID